MLKKLRNLLTVHFAIMVAFAAVLLAAVRTWFNLHQAPRVKAGKTVGDKLAANWWDNVDWMTRFTVLRLWFCTADWGLIGEVPLEIDTRYPSFQASATDFLAKWVVRNTTPAWMFWSYYKIDVGAP